MKFDVLLRLLNEASEPTRLLSEMAIFKCMPASNTRRILLNNQEKLARPSDRHGCLLTNEQVAQAVSQATTPCKQPIADHSYLLWQCLARHTCCPMKDSPAGPVSLPWRRDTISYWRRKYHKADLHSLLFLFFCEWNISCLLSGLLLSNQSPPLGFVHVQTGPLLTGTHACRAMADFDFLQDAVA